VLADGRLAGVTTHAIDRYVERVYPAAANRHMAWLHMERLVNEHATQEPEPPGWVRHEWLNGSELSVTDSWITVGDITMPTSPADDGNGLVVTTVLCRGHISEVARMNRAAKAAGRRRARAYSRKDVAANTGLFRRERRDRLARDSDSRRDRP